MARRAAWRVVQGAGSDAAMPERLRTVEGPVRSAADVGLSSVFACIARVWSPVCVGGVGRHRNEQPTFLAGRFEH